MSREPSVFRRDTGRTRSDAEDDLLTRFARGEGEALERLFRSEEPGLRRHLGARIPRGMERRWGVSDILQQTVIELIEMRDRFEVRGGPAFRGLVTRVAERALARAVRRERAAKRDIGRHASVAGSMAQWVYSPGPSPSGISMRREDLDALRASFDRLPCGDRLLLRMIDAEGRDYTEVAQALGITEAAARQRRHRALNRLRDLVDSIDGESVQRPER
ncbi:MAG: sigma-70 family RNA polymerase sigma factor [Planctomycetes bacterium]|nr:sigma-70 family RNA polymerase sigma factor [Planctomycetota bacterium]